MDTHYKTIVVIALRSFIQKCHIFRDVPVGTID